MSTQKIVTSETMMNPPRRRGKFIVRVGTNTTINIYTDTWMLAIVAVFVLFKSWHFWEYSRPDICQPIMIPHAIGDIPKSAVVGDYCIFLAPMSSKKVVNIKATVREPYTGNEEIEAVIGAFVVQKTDEIRTLIHEGRLEVF